MPEAVVHYHGKGHGEFTIGGSEDFLKFLIEPQSFCDLAELLLSNRKGIILHENMGCHRLSSLLLLMVKWFYAMITDMSKTYAIPICMTHEDVRTIG